jgi:hypothetical protein
MPLRLHAASDADIHTMASTLAAVPMVTCAKRSFVTAVLLDRACTGNDLPMHD